MENGWVVAAVLFGLVFGVISGTSATGFSQRQSARAGVMVIDGTAYVLIPAKRGVE